MRTRDPLRACVRARVAIVCGAGACAREFVAAWIVLRARARSPAAAAAAVALGLQARATRTPSSTNSVHRSNGHPRTRGPPLPHRLYVLFTDTTPRARSSTSQKRRRPKPTNRYSLISSSLLLSLSVVNRRHDFGVGSLRNAIVSPGTRRDHQRLIIIAHNARNGVVWWCTRNVLHTYNTRTRNGQNHFKSDSEQ